MSNSFQTCFNWSADIQTLPPYVPDAIQTPDFHFEDRLRDCFHIHFQFLILEKQVHSPRSNILSVKFTVEVVPSKSRRGKF